MGAQEAAEALAKQLVEEAELKTAAEVEDFIELAAPEELADFKIVEEAVATQIEEMQTEVVEDVIVEVAAPEELSPVKITSSAKTEEIEAALVKGDIVEEAADPVELAPVVDDCDDDAAPVEEAPVE